MDSSVGCYPQQHRQLTFLPVTMLFGTTELIILMERQGAVNPKPMQREWSTTTARSNHRVLLKRSWSCLGPSTGMEETTFCPTKRENSQGTSVWIRKDFPRSDDLTSSVLKVGISNVGMSPTTQDIDGVGNGHKISGSLGSDELNAIGSVVSRSVRSSPATKRRIVATISEETDVLLLPCKEEADGDLGADLATSCKASEIDVPDPSSVKCSPDEYLLLLTKAHLGVHLEAKQARSLRSFFVEITEEQMAAYTSDIVGAVRNNDLESLKKLHGEGKSLDCSNRFGESLLHMACRRGFGTITEYLLENDVSVRLCDDSGRTPLHDACWNPTPQTAICRNLIEREPSLLLVADRRGCTAFQYARTEHCDQWRTFLFENQKCLLKLQQPDILAKFAKN